MRIREEEGQATVLIALAMGIFLLGAVGLAIDGSNLFWQRTMAQTAADAAAQAAMMSIFDGTNGSGTTGFTATVGATPLACSTTDTRTPCVYAAQNGFGTTAGDSVTIYFPKATEVPAGVTFSTTDPVYAVKVTVTRSVKTTLMKLLGPTATTVKAIGMAGIVTVVSPTPILITDPTNSGTLSMNGSTSITICGGPSRSIQINSKNAAAYGGGGTVDLSHAGPADPGNCTTGTGADFGVFGGASSNPGSVSLGTTGHYLSPVSPIQDPLAGVSQPSDPGGSQPATTLIANGVDGCTNGGGCTLYSPGKYASLKPGKTTVIFKPGLYYVDGGGVDFKQTTGGGVNNNGMCVGCASDPNTGTGMTIFDTGPVSGGFAQSGGFNIGTQASIALQGPTNTTTNSQGQTVPAAPYYNVLFWEDRTAATNSHTLGQGNGCFSLIGTIYITNTQAIMAANSTHVQSVTYHGTPCSATVNQGDIIVSDLSLAGNTAISMNLVPYGFLTVRQVALVY